ncbi:amidohydrolase family protein [Aminiphilus sp.]|jgi:cytosine/adenosine deaminase-related metal-dependent hydrolase|uniref:amidohydrolase family protein n=1 Tax=Aminiphilus sp. TaxID=1872488 RepID=UPI00260F4F59|nr:amidohydrolase family protein [Aminiphilus sp.]
MSAEVLAVGDKGKDPPARGFAVGNGVIADGCGLFLDRGAVLVRNGRIVEVGDVASIRARLREGEEFCDVGGRLVLPGFFNPHHHLYSFFAVGLAPLGATPDFSAILERLWWPLDDVLDAPTLRLSALLGLCDALRHGVTTVFDHSASMSCVRGSLDILAGAFRSLGMKGLVCYEMSDRADGPKSPYGKSVGARGARGHAEENLDFWRRHRDDPLVRGAFGLHANFTLGEETLAWVRQVKPEEMPIHIHCGEDERDLRFCRDLGYAGPVDRLRRFGLLDARSLLAHLVHVSDEDLDHLERSRSAAIWNPESNANNGVGRLNRKKLSRCVLGTDGMSCDMVQTLRSACLLGEGSREDFRELGRIFFAESRDVLRRFFPDAGGLGPGRRADLTVPEYLPLTPVTAANLPGHLIYGAKNGRAFLTVGDGRILFRNGRVTLLDEEALLPEAMAAARALGERFSRRA